MVFSSVLEKQHWKVGEINQIYLPDINNMADEIASKEAFYHKVSRNSMKGKINILEMCEWILPTPTLQIQESFKGQEVRKLKTQVLVPQWKFTDLCLYEIGHVSAGNRFGAFLKWGMKLEQH